MAEYIEIDKLINDICNSTEPFTVSSVIRTIKSQPVLVWNNCEDCVFELECDTHPMRFEIGSEIIMDNMGSRITTIYKDTWNEKN